MKVRPSVYAATTLSIALISILLIFSGWSGCEHNINRVDTPSSEVIHYKVPFVWKSLIDTNQLGKSLSPPIDTNLQFSLHKKTTDLFDIILPPIEGITIDSIILQNIDLLSLIPQIPEWLSEDDRLAPLSFISQMHYPRYLKVNKDKIQQQLSEDWQLHQIQLGYQCMEDGWNIELFTDTSYMAIPVKKAWFNFPEPLFTYLFELNNTLPAEEFAPLLKHQLYLQQSPIVLGMIRRIEQGNPIPFTDTLSLEGLNDVLQDVNEFPILDCQEVEKRLPKEKPLPPLARTIKNNIRLESKVKANEIEFHFLNCPKYGSLRLITGGFQLPDITIKHKAEKAPLFSRYVPLGIYDNRKLKADRLQTDGTYNYAFLINERNEWLDSDLFGFQAVQIIQDKEKEGWLNVLLVNTSEQRVVGRYDVQYYF